MRTALTDMPKTLSMLLRNQRIDWLFYLSHPSNVRSIVENGILSYNLVDENRIPHASLASHGVQIRRNRYVALSDRPLHDYVPLYLVRRTPMLWDIRHKPHVFILVDLRIADNAGTLYTDGNAASDLTRFFSDPVSTGEIPWDILHRGRWTGSGIKDGRRKRCAEILVPDRVDARFILEVVCSPTHEIELPLGHRYLRTDRPSFLEP